MRFSRDFVTPATRQEIEIRTRVCLHDMFDIKLLVSAFIEVWAAAIGCGAFAIPDPTHRGAAVGPRLEFYRVAIAHQARFPPTAASGQTWSTTVHTLYHSFVRRKCAPCR